MADYFTERTKLNHRLQGVINALGEEIAETLEGALATVSGQLADLTVQSEKTTVSMLKRQQRLERQKAGIEKALTEVYEDIGQVIKSRSLETAQAIPEIAAAILDKSLPEGVEAGLTLRTITKERLAAYWDSFQVEGQYFTNWLSKLKGNTAARIVKTAQESLVLGESSPALWKRLQEALSMGRQSAVGLAQTALHHAVSWAEHQTYLNNANRLKGYRFVAELDRRTTDICRSLDGREFSLTEAPIPPLHWKCRSWLHPLLKDVVVNGKRVPFDDALGPKYDQVTQRIARIETQPRTVHHRDGTTSTAYRGYEVKFVPRNTTYNQWMTSMVKSSDARDVAFAREALGPTRFNLVASGKLKMESLYYQGKLRTIKELKELTQ
jgi:SPP1 gp7 family putative phage head morphogenesis protein